ISRQKPVPNPASKRRVGASPLETSSFNDFNDGTILIEVIGTTTSLKSSVRARLAGTGSGARAFCATAPGEMQKHASKLSMILRTVIMSPGILRAVERGRLHELLQPASIPARVRFAF